MYAMFEIWKFNLQCLYCLKFEKNYLQCLQRKNLRYCLSLHVPVRSVLCSIIHILIKAPLYTPTHTIWTSLQSAIIALQPLHTSLPHTFGQKDPNAKPIHEVSDLASLVVDTNTQGTQWGTGGMATKLTAARIATAGGCSTV